MLYFFYLLGLVLTAGVSLTVALWIRRQTTDRAGTAMIALLVVHAVMATFLLAQLLSTSLRWKFTWSRLWFALVLANSAIWFLFAVYYTGREHWLTRPVWAMLGAYVAGQALVVLSDPIHGLLFTEAYVDTTPFPHLQKEWTGVTNLLMLAAYVPVFVGFGLLFRMLLFSRRTTWWQTVGLLIGMLAVSVPATLSVTSYVPITGFPYGIYGAGVFGVIVGVSLFKHRMFAVAPLARDALFSSLEEAVLVVDARLMIVDYNDTAVETFPDLDGRIGDRLGDVYPDFVRDDARSDGGVTPAEGAGESPFADSIRQTTGDGLRSLRVSVSTISSGGEPRGYGLVIRDVTELERRTRQLERFASVLSHDLRNPVSVASGHAELALETGDVEHVQQVVTSLDRIDETIADLLTLATEGDAIDDQTVVALSEQVESAWTTTETGSTVLENEIDPDHRIRADASRLRTVFENLFRNAVDHGGTTVSVRTFEDGFIVDDDGPGIPDDERERVFEYGYSSDEGTGFGLAIVASVAEGHGWNVSVEESPSGGARFLVSNVTAVQ